MRSCVVVHVVVQSCTVLVHVRSNSKVPYCCVCHGNRRMTSYDVVWSFGRMAPGMWHVWCGVAGMHTRPTTRPTTPQPPPNQDLPPGWKTSPSKKRPASASVSRGRNPPLQAPRRSLWQRNIKQLPLPRNTRRSRYGRSCSALRPLQVPHA